MISSLDSLNRMRIVIDRRLNTVKHCDRILVVDGGCIVEEGIRKELIAKGGFCRAGLAPVLRSRIIDPLSEKIIYREIGRIER